MDGTSILGKDIKLILIKNKNSLITGHMKLKIWDINII